MNFKETIKNYLDKQAELDPAFAIKYNNKDKNIDSCCQYIMGEARKQMQSGCAVLPDEEVYYLARHYYNEEDIKVEKVTSVRVEHSTTIEEKKPIPKVKKKKESNVEKISLFEFED